MCRENDDIAERYKDTPPPKIPVFVLGWCPYFILGAASETAWSSRPADKRAPR